MKDYKEDILYTDEIKDAVRYGYMYRKEAEKLEENTVHYCHGNTPDILLWLANLIIGGATWDVLKEAAKKLHSSLAKSLKPLAKTVESVLTEEQELNQFYVYVKEFNEHNMSITKKHFQYIREEIIADFVGKEVSKIYIQRKRMPTTEDYVHIFREANAHADRLMNERSEIECQ